MRLTEPALGMRGGSLSEAVEVVEFHRQRFKGGTRVSHIRLCTSSGLDVSEGHIRIARTIRILLGWRSTDTRGHE